MAQIPQMGILLIVFGVPLVLWPYQIAKAHEILDAIGRRSAGPVEPAGWYVKLTRIGGSIFIIIGVAWIVGAIS